ncbi:hypothetical protein MKY64_23600 [Paenibacillus sp. FSL R7-0210]|uniref:hypothetical protein n=1 Tax=Paenibacillus sp. FSL R7-0210 TaxID=2921676 RepID=UPI0030F563A7
MLELTVSQKIFNKRPDKFIKEHITQLLIDQYNNSYKTETSNAVIAFNFFSDHALIITSSKEGEIYLYQQMEYESMLPESLSKSLDFNRDSLPIHWKKWLEKSQFNLVRKEFSQALNFNRLSASYNEHDETFYWNWKGYKNICFRMNNTYVFEEVVT